MLSAVQYSQFCAESKHHFIWLNGYYVCEQCGVVLDEMIQFDKEREIIKPRNFYPKVKAYNMPLRLKFGTVYLSKHSRVSEYAYRLANRETLVEKNTHLAIQNLQVNGFEMQESIYNIVKACVSKIIKMLYTKRPRLNAYVASYLCAKKLEMELKIPINFLSDKRMKPLVNMYADIIRGFDEILYYAVRTGTLEDINEEYNQYVFKDKVPYKYFLNVRLNQSNMIAAKDLLLNDPVPKSVVEYYASTGSISLQSNLDLEKNFRESARFLNICNHIQMNYMIEGRPITDLEMSSLIKPAISIINSILSESYQRVKGFEAAYAVIKFVEIITGKKFNPILPNQELSQRILNGFADKLQGFNEVLYYVLRKGDRDSIREEYDNSEFKNLMPFDYFAFIRLNIHVKCDQRLKFLKATVSKEVFDYFAKK